jgi:hypothetical protein
MSLNRKGEFFDYDPVTGVTEYFHEGADGQWSITYEQDVTPHLELAKALRNQGMTDEAWAKNGVTNYAIIPLVVQGHMLKAGINFMDPNHIGAVVNYVNTVTPYLKTTDKHHEVR